MGPDDRCHPDGRLGLLEHAPAPALLRRASDRHGLTPERRDQPAPEASARLKEPNTKERKFEEVVKEVQSASALMIVGE